MRSSYRLGAVLVVLLAAPQARADYPNCISGTPNGAAVDAWRKGAIQAVHGFTNDVPTNITKCFGANPPACLQRVVSYGGRNDIATADADQPMQSVPARNPPPEILAPGAAGQTYFVPTTIEDIAKQKGWITARYKSRHSGGFDPGTPSLLMVYIPGSTLNPPVTYDRWLNFPIPADDTPNAVNPVPQKNLPNAQDYANENTNNQDYPRTFTMVSLERATDTQPAQVYFQMFRRDSTDGTWTPQPNSEVGGCVSCHPNGMRAISPLGFHVRAGEQQLPIDEWNNVKAMNDAMDDAAGGKLVSWRGATVNGVFKPFMKPASSWPIMGALKPMNKYTRTQQYIMGGTLNGQTYPGCYKRRTTVNVSDIFGRPPGAHNVYSLSASPQINWQNVRNAMICETCHNNRQRYAITSNTDRSTIDYKILVDQSMPLGFHQDPAEQRNPTAPPIDTLTPDERIALANCLEAEMGEESKQLDTWLSQVSCQ